MVYLKPKQRKATTVSHTRFLYLITCLKDGRRYVGVTSDPSRRWVHHQTYLRASALGRAIKEFGHSMFQFRVIGCAQGTDNASEMERALITQYRSNEDAYGFNRTTGGYTGGRIVASTREKLSRQRIGNTHARRVAVRQLGMDGSLVAVFSSTKQASEQTGIQRRAITRCFARPDYTAGGYRWVKQGECHQ